jgi:ferredoxin
MEELEYEWLLNRKTIIPYKMCFGRFRELFEYDEAHTKKILELLEKEEKVILIPFSGIKVIFHVQR